MALEHESRRSPPWFELSDAFERDGALYPSTLTGWRSWRVVELDGARHLTSTVAHDVWEPRRRFAAICRGRDDVGSGERSPTAPCADHGCGIYARKHRLPATYVTTGPRAVVGLVALWGRVIEHEHGYRARFGYPVAFVEPSLERERRLVRELAARYGAALI